MFLASSRALTWLPPAPPAVHAGESRKASLGVRRRKDVRERSKARRSRGMGSVWRRAHTACDSHRHRLPRRAV